MSRILRTPVDATPAIGGAAIGIAGAALLFHHWIAVPLIVVGAVLELGAVARHDRRHRRRGESVHAMWGPDDMNRPRWLASRKASD